APAGDAAQARGGVRPRASDAPPLEQLVVVLAVAEGDRPLRSETDVLGEELETGALRHFRARDLEEEGQRLRDVEAAGEALLQARLESVEQLGLPDRDDLRRRFLQ